MKTTGISHLLFAERQWQKIGKLYKETTVTVGGQKLKTLLINSPVGSTPPYNDGEVTAKIAKVSKPFGKIRENVWSALKRSYEKGQHGHSASNTSISK